ncbi:MAG TPA: helix-turn-helix domain-containing protein [Trebonia sp.]|nr:helix-turn-helix domain-containing protein [Trebonia sp.]
MEHVNEHAWRVPSARLRPFVSSYVGYRQEGGEPSRHRGLPSPALTFIVTLDDPLVIEAHPDPRQPAGSYDTLLGGLHTSPALISQRGRQSGIQLSLTPLGARALLGMPAGELANWDEDATAVMGGFAAELRERSRARQSWAERFAVLDELLGQRAAGLDADQRRPIRPEVAHVWRRLRDTRGAAPVAKLAAETGWSARYLNSAFRAETGLGPKAAARVFRFDHARHRITRTAAAGARFADLAADCGYYDQAHLAREFRDLAGCPPTQWLAEEFRFVQAMPLAVGECSGA